MSVVVLGSIFVDIKGYPTDNFIPGAGRNAGRVKYVHGGVSRNIAEDLGNMGLSPVFLSLVDDSGVGADVIARLKSHGVNTDYVRQVQGGMGTWLAVFDNSNDVAASVSVRPNLSPLMDVLRDNGDEIFARADSVLLEMDMESELCAEIFRLSEKHGKRIYAAVSNINIALERRDFVRRLSCLVCNRIEAEIFFSVPFGHMELQALAVELSERIVAARIPAMVVTLGGDGAIWADIDGNYGICQPINVPVADTTGAGDAFFAGTAAGLTYGKTLAESCDIGTRLASAVICTVDNTCPRFMPKEFGL